MITVGRLRDILGTRLVAYITGQARTSVVESWAAGDTEPSDADMCRMRIAARVSDALGEDPITTQSWFMGMNPYLYDEAPATCIRDIDFSDGVAAFNTVFDLFSAARSDGYGC